MNHSDAGGRVRWTLRAHDGGARTARTAARGKADRVEKATGEAVPVRNAGPAAEDGWRPRPRGVDPGAARERMGGAVTAFVDDPRGAVQEADALAAEVADALVAEIESRRAALRDAWDEGADTETLRLALRSYRSFVQSLVTGR
ncbi:hypothetical protein SUDANB121_02927 [Nocardiopsis dassonvillei]|uniref:hypothetical protein n=1 Tax=Nocardiopsis dassonvillei TaxID=2014 RepID=UPI003F5682A4